MHYSGEMRFRKGQGSVRDNSANRTSLRWSYVPSSYLMESDDAQPDVRRIVRNVVGGAIVFKRRIPPTGMDRKHRASGRVYRPCRGGGGRKAVSALRLHPQASLRPRERLAALPLPELPALSQRVDGHAACTIAQVGMLAAVSAMRARIAHGARCGARRQGSPDDEFQVAPPVRARGDARPAEHADRDRRGG